MTAPPNDSSLSKPSYCMLIFDCGLLFCQPYLQPRFHLQSGIPIRPKIAVWDKFSSHDLYRSFLAFAVIAFSHGLSGCAISCKANFPAAIFPLPHCPFMVCPALIFGAAVPFSSLGTQDYQRVEEISIAKPSLFQ